MILLFPEG